VPLSINVGLSRKASQDFQSTGVSINVTAELDQSLLARPEELQQQIAGLYAQAEHALDRQAGAPGPPDTRPPRENAHYGRNGHGTAGRSNGNGGGMTDSQRRAIFAIARDARVDPAYESEQMIGAPLDQLNVRQASDLIDHLKSMAPARNGR